MSQICTIKFGLLATGNIAVVVLYYLLGLKTISTKPMLQCYTYLSHCCIIEHVLSIVIGTPVGVLSLSGSQ